MAEALTRLLQFVMLKTTLSGREKTMSTSQHVLYIGSYAAADQPGIYAFTFDDATGNLIEQGTFAGIVNPSFLLVHPNGRWLYAVSETSQQENGTPGAVWAFRCSREPWSIEPINHQASGGDAPCHLEIDSTGRWLLVSNYSSGCVGVLPILDDGSLGEMTDLIQHNGSGPNAERQEGPHAHSATFTPDHHFAIVADLGIDALLVYAFDPVAGRLHVHTRISTRPGAGPRHMAFHPDGKHVLVANELDNTVAVYNYDAVSGELREWQTIDTLPPNAPESYVADIHVSPTGDRVYVSNRGHESIAVFQVEADGRLALIAIRPCGGRFPRNFALAPGNRFLLVANQHSDDVVVLPMQDDPETLDAPIASTAVRGASCVHFVAVEG
jgi:6-phosphogluconolactonase